MHENDNPLDDAAEMVRTIRVTASAVGTSLMTGRPDMFMSVAEEVLGSAEVAQGMFLLIAGLVTGYASDPDVASEGVDRDEAVRTVIGTMLSGALAMVEGGLIAHMTAPDSPGRAVAMATSTWTPADMSKVGVPAGPYLLADGRVVDCPQVYWDRESPRGGRSFRIENPSGGRRRWLRFTQYEEKLQSDGHRLPKHLYQAIAEIHGSPPVAVPLTSWEVPDVGHDDVEEFLAALTSARGSYWVKKFAVRVAYLFGTTGVHRTLTLQVNGGVKGWTTATFDEHEVSNVLGSGTAALRDTSVISETVTRSRDCELEHLFRRFGRYVDDLAPPATVDGAPRRGEVPDWGAVLRSVRWVAPAEQAATYFVERGLVPSAVRVSDTACSFTFRIAEHPVVLDLRAGTITTDCAHADDYRMARKVAELTDSLPDFEAAVEPHARAITA